MSKFRLKELLERIDFENPKYLPPANDTFDSEISKSEFMDFVVDNVKTILNFPEPEITQNTWKTVLIFSDGTNTLEITIFFATSTDFIQHYTGMFYFDNNLFKIKFIAW